MFDTFAVPPIVLHQIGSWTFRFRLDNRNIVRADVVTPEGRLRTFRGQVWVEVWRVRPNLWRITGSQQVVEDPHTIAQLEAGYTKLVQT